jgi:hypothetical protein
MKSSETTPNVQRFTTKLRRRDVPGTTTFLRVPLDVMKAFAPRKRVAVSVSIAGHSWRSTVAPYGDEFLVPVRAEIRALIGAAPGDTVVVEISRDDAPRTVDVPPDLQTALDAAGASAGFSAFAFSHQQEYVRWIDEAKRPETRQARVAKTVNLKMVLK